jgi:anti-sigma factor RsiW
VAVDRTHAEIQELLGAYALDATDAEEGEAIEAHLVTCPWCREEVRRHREVAAVLASGTEVAPPSIWDRIVDQIDGDEAPSLPAPRPLGPVPAPADEPGSGGRVDRSADRRRPGSPRSAGARRWLVAAAVVVVIGVVGVLLGVVAHQQGQIDDLDQAVRSTTTSVAASKSASLVDEQQNPVGRVVIAADGTARFVNADGIAPLDEQHVYQLWGVVGDEKISLVVLRDDPTEATFTVPSQVTTLALTEEQSPGVVASVQPALAAGPVA